MKLYRMQVPINSYEDDGTVHQQNLFILAEECPIFAAWLEYAKWLHNEDKQCNEYTGDWLQVVDVLTALSLTDKQFLYLKNGQTLASLPLDKGFVSVEVARFRQVR